MANSRRRARRSKTYKIRKFRDAIEGAAANAVRPTPRFGINFYQAPRDAAEQQARIDDEAKHNADHEADRAKAKCRLTKPLRGLAPQNLTRALTHTNDLVRETALTGPAPHAK